MLAGEPDDRTIIWVTDPQGGSGKSRLARHLIMEHGACLLGGRVQDMAYQYDNERIVIFDVSRAQAEYSDHLYTMAEALKNGTLVSTKYESEMKLFGPPHVIFFCNFSWNRDKWTGDRVREVFSGKRGRNQPLVEAGERGGVQLGDPIM